MKIRDALNKIKPLVGKKFSEIFTDDDLKAIIKNKGKTGQILELAIGLKLSSTNIDFEDGELKSNKCNSNGKPIETMFITQISGIIDDLLSSKEYKKTKLFEKIAHILYVPICKEGEPKNWFILDAFIVEDNELYKDVYVQLEKDYYIICDTLKQHIENTGKIHTSNGELMQVRSKDSKPYTPIHSKLLGIDVSNKNHAFYFKREFMQTIIKKTHPDGKMQLDSGGFFFFFFFAEEK